MKAGWLVAMATVFAGTARADDDKSGTLTSWSHLVDGKVVATESTRAVAAASGNFFASGEMKWKTGKKGQKRTHLQTNGDKLVRYQRLDGGAKAPGVRIFEWEQQLRLAQVNSKGKPVDLGQIATTRVWDGDLLHLVAHWGLPKACRTAKLSFFDVGSQSTKEANLTCTGSKRATDAEKRTVELNTFTLGGVSGDPVELWVDGQGGLVGAKIGKRTMLRSKFAIEGSREVAPAVDEDADDEEKKAIRDRGVGE